MKRMHAVSSLALEFFTATGRRTETRLRELVQHYAGSYAITSAEEIERLYQEARAAFERRYGEDAFAEVTA